MADAAISFTVQKLGDLLIQKVVFLQDVDEQVERLKDELKRMQCFLKDAREKQANDERVRNWISDIRDVAHDAEDVIDTFILKVDTPRSRRGLLGRWACFPNQAYQINKIREEIKSIKARLIDIAESRERYGIQNLGEGALLPRNSGDVDEWRRRLSPWQKDKQVVGFKKDAEMLLSRAILAKKKGLSVAGIVGMAGIGKSTLARIVYNHHKVVHQFDRRAWVVISSEFNQIEIIKELIQQLLRPSEDQLKILKTMEKSQLSHLQKMLHERLQGKRFLIVFDDVWKNEHWEILAKSFPVEDKASTLLLTSRTQDIVSRAGYVHKMKTLDATESWELFLNKAFVDNTKGKFPKDMEKIGREILKKCDGLPLAITVVGGLVAKQRQSGAEWESFAKEISSHLRRENSVSAILELSYHNLPAELKACFLCLGLFKEDAIIHAKRLIHIWIAQGLIPQEGRKESKEEIARNYLDEMINRNMIQVKDMGEGNKVKSLHIHDLLRELSIKKANEEINFEILGNGAGPSGYLYKPRHRAVNYSQESFSYSAKRNKRVRSLFFHGAGNIDGRPSFWKSFKLLRVLDFEDFGLKKLPDTIGALIGLRYLGLRNNFLKDLPSSLRHLKNLEVLDIAENIFIQLPNVLWKMIRLRHLYMSRIKCNKPLKIDSLKNLQTVTYIPVQNWAPRNPKEMTSLHELGIEIDADSNLMELCTSLTMLENLVSLNLRWYGFKSMASLDKLSILRRLTHLKLRGALNTLPSARYFPPNLSCLSLVGTWLVEDPMPILEKLPKLWYLKLDCAYNGDEMVISNDGFPRLEVLSVYGLVELRNIEVRKGGLSGLKLLEINECPHLKSLPKKLRLVSNLQGEK